jgi:hypothetical protein
MPVEARVEVVDEPVGSTDDVVLDFAEWREQQGRDPDWNNPADRAEYRAYLADARPTDDDLPSFFNPDELDEPVPRLTPKQHRALDMEELGLDPGDPDDRGEYERLLAVGAEVAAEIPPALLAAIGRTLEANREAENEVAWWRFGRDPDEPVTDVPAHVTRAVARAQVAAEAMKVAYRFYRLGRIGRIAVRVRARARARRSRQSNVRRGPRKSRAPDPPHESAADVARLRAGVSACEGVS